MSVDADIGPLTSRRVWYRLLPEDITLGEFRRLTADLADETPLAFFHSQDDTLHRLRKIAYWLFDEGTEKQDDHLALYICFAEQPIQCSMGSLCRLLPYGDWRQPIHSDDD